MDAVVHLAITRRVRKEHAGEFAEALADFARKSLQEPGTRGVHLLHPPPDSGSTEFGILRSFASEADRAAFYRSQLYREWTRRIESMVEGDSQIRELNGLEAWFRDPRHLPPPRWKMALLTWIAVWPVSMLVPAVLLPVLGPGFNKILAAGLIAAGIVLILTWLAMPLLVRLFRKWLHN